MPIFRPALLPAAALAMLALAGCKVDVHDKDGGKDTSISFGDGNDADTGNGVQAGDRSVAINVPGFSAKVKMPDLDLGDDTKIDDLKLFPGTKVTGMKITGDAGDDSDGDDSGGAKGDVDMRFTAPAAPSALADYYKAEAAREGWTAIPPVAPETFAATRPNDRGGTTRFALSADAAGGGSAGHLAVSGR